MFIDKIKITQIIFLFILNLLSLFRHVPNKYFNVYLFLNFILMLF